MKWHYKMDLTFNYKLLYTKYMGTQVSVKEAAVIMQLHEHTVRKLIKQGKLEAFNSGRKWLIDSLSIPAFMRKETK